MRPNVRPSEFQTACQQKKLYFKFSDFPCQSIITKNFPVGSIVLPRRLRKPIHAVYAFARTADDIADEGNAEAAERLRQLDELKAELDRIAQGGKPQTALMQRLYNEAIEPFQLPLQPFYDLLAAFSQDVGKTRYETLVN